MIKTQESLCNILQKLIKEEIKNDSELDDYWLELNRQQIESQVEIGHIQFKGEPDVLDEYLEIKNRGSLTIDISGWRVDAGSPGQKFLFGKGSVLAAFETLKVYTQGDGQYSFNSKKAVWNNKGDLATLSNAKGEIISTYAYGIKAHGYLIISHILFDGQEYRTEGDEFVELTNLSDHRVDLQGWKLQAYGNESHFEFPSGAILEPLTSARVFTNKLPLASNEYSFNSSVAIWNNKQGGCRLLDYQGIEVNSYHY